MSQPTHPDGSDGTSTGVVPPAADRPAHPNALLIAVAAAAAVCLVLLAFSWPVLTAKPRELPVAITGQPQLVQQLQATISGQSDAIELIRVDDRAAAVSAIQDREAVGAVVLDLTQPEVLSAPPAGNGPTQVMNQLTAGLQQRLGQPAAATGVAAPQLKITKVVDYGPDDPTGSRLAIVGLPLTIGGVLGGALISMAIGRLSRQLTALGVYALAAGFGLAAILQFWYGALIGQYLINGLALALGVFAVAGVVVGLRRLLGVGGIGLAAVIFILGANPISGATVPSEFLPEPWATLGQATPQGAGPTLLRNLSYFPDASTGQAWLVLGCWAAGGLLLIMISLLRRQAPTRSTAAHRLRPAASH
ncbi:MAG TPA: hypothetical protein VIP98_10890 [Microlunatus sp.]